MKGAWGFFFHIHVLFLLAYLFRLLVLDYGYRCSVFFFFAPLQSLQQLLDFTSFLSLLRPPTLASLGLSATYLVSDGSSSCFRSSKAFLDMSAAQPTSEKLCARLDGNR